MYVIYCIPCSRDSSSIPLGNGELGKEIFVSVDWFSIKPSRVKAAELAELP